MAKHVILDTDVGEDPDEVFAVLLALASKEIKVDLIVTSDEQGGKRAAFAKALLKALGREDIPVVRGHEGVQEKKLFVVDGLVNELVKHGQTSIPQPEDYIGAIKRVVELNESTYYVCISPFTNLAEFVRKEPELASKLDVVIMGGAINYRDPNRAEHNVRYSISDTLGPNGRPKINASLDVFNSSLRMRWVLSDTTFKPDQLGVRRGDVMYQMLEGAQSPAAKLLIANCEGFFASTPYPCTIMHDPLTLSYVIDPRFITFEERRVAMAETGIMRNAEDAVSGMITRTLIVSTDAKYDEFMAFLTDRLKTLLTNNTELLSKLKRVNQGRRLKTQ